MGACTYMSYNCTFPKGTEMNEDSYLFSDRFKHDEGDRWSVYQEGEGRYSDSYLNDLVELLCGRQLDKVPGLELDANFQNWDDGEWESTITIRDGKVTCQETETRWIDSDLDRIGANIGQPRVKDARDAWKMLGEAPMDDDGNLLADRFLIVGYYHAGTNREEVWHDIESVYNVSVAYLMGQAKNPDGSNE